MAMELQALSVAERDALAERVETMQKKHAVAIETLSTAEERAAYVKGIPEEVTFRSPGTSGNGREFSWVSLFAPPRND